METDAAHSSLRQVAIELIDHNPENPRILFRPGEMEQLLESIRLYGVQVPISVYKDGSRFVLIDGERRWRCSLKLNRRFIPALVQAKPKPLTNLLLMFNIHALREQWDLLTIALKLPRVIELLKKELGEAPSERDVSAKTGLSLGVIRRCKLLIELPEKYKSLILEELEKPKPRQKLTEDFFIEMERALKTVQRAMPEVVDDKDTVREVLIDKYRKGVIPNIVQFRKVAKVARADRVSADKPQARRVLGRLFRRNSYSIDDAFNDSVSEAYAERDLKSRIEGLLNRLDGISSSDLDEDLRQSLGLLAQRIQALLEEE
ncbi:MAG: ParB/RepB/Spo0J family partition protein [Thermoanaerobaculia bacterium]